MSQALSPSPTATSSHHKTAIVLRWNPTPRGTLQPKWNLRTCLTVLVENEALILSFIFLRGNHGSMFFPCFFQLVFASFLTLEPSLHVLRFLWKTLEQRDFVNVIFSWNGCYFCDLHWTSVTLAWLEFQNDVPFLKPKAPFSPNILTRILTQNIVTSFISEINIKSPSFWYGRGLRGTDEQGQKRNLQVRWWGTRG